MTFGGLQPARRTQEAVQQAVLRLREPATEGREAVSWFRLDTPSDREAYQALTAGDLAGAQQCWERAAVAHGERSAEENLAVLHHILALQDPLEPAVWLEALAWLGQAASGGNVHRQDVCARVVTELTNQIRSSASDGNSRRLMQLLHIVVPYLEESARVALEQELFKKDIDRLKLACAELRGQLLAAHGQSPQRVGELEKAIGNLVVPQVERLLQTGLPGPSETASREAALIYRSLGRTWAGQRERKERCLALESAARYAPADLRDELLAELETARLDQEAVVDRVDLAPPSAEQLPPVVREWDEVLDLPQGFSMLGTGLRLTKSGPGQRYEARYDLSVLGFPIFPLRRYQVLEEFPGSPTRIETLPLSVNALLMRVLFGFVLGLILLLGVGQLTGRHSNQGLEAQRQALAGQIDELLEKVSDRAERLHRVEVELKEVREQEEYLGEGEALAQARARKGNLKAEHSRLKEEHEQLLDKLFRLEAKRQSLR